MSLEIKINFPDKIIAGLNQSYTISSTAGKPSGTVTAGGRALEHRIVPLGPPKELTAADEPVMKYKLTFLLPPETAGEELVLSLRAGESSLEERKPITAE